MITRKNLTIGAIVFAAAFTPLAHAYQFDLEGRFANLTVEEDFEDGDFEVDSYAISGRVYISDVSDDSALPFEELGNFSQISNFALEIEEVDPEFGDNDTGFTIDGEGFLTGKKQFVYGSYSDDGDDIDQFIIGYGGFFRDNFQGRVGFVRDDFRFADGIGVNGSLDAVFAFGNGSYLVTRGELTVVSGEIESFGDDEDYASVDFEAGLDFYPTKQLGIGIGLDSEVLAVDDGDDTTYTTTTLFIKANFHANESVNFSASYGFGETGFEDDFSEGDEDLDGFMLEAGFRF